MATTTCVHFPDLSMRLDAADLDFELKTFDPDNDDDGRARDFGVTLAEGSFVDDGVKGTVDLDLTRVRQIASLIEHAPDLFDCLEAFLDGENLTPAAIARRRKAAGVLAEIRNGELRYDR